MTHHANNFMILMEQYDQAKKYMDIASTSSGESIEKFTAYQESLSGSIEDFKNAAQSLSNTTLDSSFLKDIVNTGTGAIEFLDWLIDKFGILQTLIGGFAIGKGITSNGLGKRNAGLYKIKQNYRRFINVEKFLASNKNKPYSYNY